MVGQCLPNLSFDRVGAKALRQWLPLVGISAVSRCGYPPNAVSATEVDAGRDVNRSLPSHFMQDQVKLIHYSCPSHARHNSLRYVVIVRASSKLVAGENNPPTHPAEFCRTSTELCRSVCSRSCLVASPHHAFSVCAIPKGAF